MSDEKKEYIVTAPNLELTDSLWDDLLSDAETPDTIPDRPVEVARERKTNPRNTTYWLTDEEAEKLRQDPRVEAVTDITKRAIARFAFQEGTFNKTTDDSGERQNWGLLRHINTTNIFGTATDDPGGTYNYVLDGTGVDVVILDSGIQADHPEFQDADGNSRVQQIDWYAMSGVSGTQPAGFYTDYDGHGTHVAGTLAGKTFGWAKNAHIYSIKLAGLEGQSDPNNGISSDDAFDCILGWHQSKSNGRPTVINNSWGFVIFWDTTLGAFTYNLSTYYDITGGSYRGTAWSGSEKDPTKGHQGQLIATDLFAFAQRDAATDADISTLIANGIIVCNASGNGNMKHDVVGGSDYNNYVTAQTIGNFYYHRGGSPNSSGETGFEVGATGATFVGSVEARSVYSDSGPGVDIYSAGDNIISAMSSTNIQSSDASYYLDSNYKQASLSGTSMACPQIAGICALVLQAHPDWTPFQVYNWVVSKTRSTLYNTGLDNDYSSVASLLGGSNRMAYFPMNGQRPFQFAGS